MGCVGLALTLVRGLPHHVQLSGIQDSSSVLFSFFKRRNTYIYMLACQNCRVCWGIPGIPYRSTTSAAFPTARVKALDRIPSDHNPLLVELGDNIFIVKGGLGLKNGG
jgi:hypothetical protein